MAENLRRGYSNLFYYKSKAEFDKVSSHIRPETTDNPDAFFYYDSEDNIIYKAVSPVSGTIKTSKWCYKNFAEFGNSNMPTSLANAYNYKTYFTDKNDIPEIGRLGYVNTNQKFFVDQGNDRVLYKPKVSGIGNTLADFDSENAYWKPPTRISSALLGFGSTNMLDSDIGSFSVYEGAPLQLKVSGQNILTNNTGRLFYHTSYLNNIPPIIRLNKDGIKDCELFNSDDFNVGTAANTPDGKEYIGALSNSSTSSFTILLDNVDYERGSKYTFRYTTELSDSEIQVRHPDPRIKGDSDFVPILYDSDEGVVSSFDTNEYDGTEAPWKVFSDSDNDGFKALLGVQSGFIGYKDLLHYGYQYNLMKVLVKNTISVPHENQPSDFNIEGLNKDGNWIIIDQIRNFNGYIFEKEYLDSDYLFIGFRINVLSCRAGFDSDHNALEIKKIQFTTQKETQFVELAGSSWFGKTANRGYYFSMPQDTYATGLMIGGGGGGGGGNVPDVIGGGGGGGAFVRIDNIRFKADNVYKITIGGGGGQNTDAAATILTNLTTGKDIIIAGGGKTGGTTTVNTGTALGGRGGKAKIYDSDFEHELAWWDSDGGHGGTFINRVENPGDWGVQTDIDLWVDKDSYITEPNYDMCSGGGCGTWMITNLEGMDNYNAGAHNNGPSAGRGNGWDTIYGGASPGIHNRGGGGGGGGTWVSASWRRARGGRYGGHGYAYFHFK